MALLIVLNNYTHDFCAAGWLFGTVLLWVLVKRDIPSGEAGVVIADMVKKTMLLIKVSLAGIVVLGIVRTLAYKKYEWNAVVGDTQVTFLMIKHIFLTVLVVLGAYFYFKARNHLRKFYHEKTE